jgi:RNA polymerase sigma-70 factor (ECF subfamily)
VSDERRLVRRIQEGDQRAFAQLLDLYEARIYRLALRFVGSESDAEDVTQEIFVGIYRNIGGFRGASSLSTWIYRVAVNHCLEFRRKRKRDSVPYDEEIRLASADWRDDPVQVTTKRELTGTVEKALQQLSPIHRDVVILHEMQGLTYQECADALQVPVGTVKSRLSNAFSRLREILRGSACEDG